jgi:hypothetical protein
MIPLLYCALADTDIVEVPADLVLVHEWGVVELDEGRYDLKGARWGYLDGSDHLIDYIPDEVEAPVIWFHGAACTGTFSVEVTGGVFTELLPYPDSITVHAIPGIEASETQVAVWRDLKIDDNMVLEMPVVVEDETEEARRVSGEWTEYEEEGIPAMSGYYYTGFDWAIPLWREVNCNTVHYPAADYKDSFLYYECTFNPYHMFDGDYYGYEGPALLFLWDENELACFKVNTPNDISTDTALTEDEILAEICSWADGGLKSSEIGALWNTWEPAIRTRCDYYDQTVIVFPLSPEQVEMISRIRFVPDGDFQVRYDRLFLGLGMI